MNTKKIFGYGKRNLFFAITVIMAFAALSLTGCPTDDDTGGTKIPVTGVTIVEPQSAPQDGITLAVGADITLVASVIPANATNKAVTWETSDATKATVVDGVVTGVAVGSAKIIVTTADGGFTAECTVAVKELSSIAVTTPPTKTTYNIGESLDITGLAVTATFSDNSTAPVSHGDLDISGFDSTEAGEVTVTVTYLGKEATFDVTVKELSSIAVTTPPTKTTYSIGETLNIDGLVVTATFSDNSTAVVTVTIADISGFDSTEAGEVTVTVTYGGKEATFDVTIVPTYTVTFNSNGGSAVSPITGVVSGATITKPADPTKANSVFDGWYKEAGLTNAWNFATDTVSADIELHAKWTATYTVTFNSNGGSEVSPITEVTGGATITKPADPAKAGSVFDGWYKETGLTNAWNFATDTVTGNITLYAKWAIPPTITTTSLPNGNLRKAYSQTLNATGDTPITWSIVSGASLPTGLSLNETTGLISGTPTEANTFNFTVKATNAAGSSEKPLSIIIIQPGTIWTTVSDSTFTSAITGIAYGNNMWVAVGAGGRMATSTDGTNWTAVSFSPFSAIYYINGIAYGNNMWVAVGDSGKMATSVNGTNWTAVSDSAFGTNTIFGIAYGNGMFVAGGWSGKMATSTDGTSWTAVSDSAFGTNPIRAIAYGNNTWIAVGDGGKMATSTNGTSWTAVSDSAFGASSIFGIAYDNDTFVAVGAGGKMAYSTNGTSWTAVSNSTFGTSTNTINAIAYGDNTWVAVGYGGKMAYSTNGASWTAVSDSTFGTNPICAIAYGNNTWIAVGEDGGKMAWSE